MRKSSPRTALSPFRRYWWVAIPAFLATMGGAIAYLMLTPNLYEAKARLSVEDERTSVSDIGQTLSEADELGGSNPIVTQAEVVKSQVVLRSALASYQDGPEAALEDSSPSASTPSTSPSSPQVLDDASTEAPSVGELMGGLQVKIIPATNILELSYQDEDPQQAAALVNAVAQAAVTRNVEDINLEAAKVRNFLEAQLRALQARLLEAQQAESQYRQSTGLLAVDAQNQAMVGSLAALEQEERSLLSTLEEATTRDQRLKDITGIDSPEAANAIARVGQDPQLQTLRAQITEARTALVEARSRLGEQHPDLLALIDQVDGLEALYQQRLSQVSPNGLGSAAADLSSNDLSQALIAQSITSSIEEDALRDRLNVVRSELGRLRTQVTQQPAVQQPLTVLARETQEAADSLELIRQKLEEARIAEAQLVSNVRVVGLAEPETAPISPSPLAVLALGVIAGTILSVGAILLLDLLDASLQSGEEVEKLVKLPVLGYLPRLSADLVDIEGLDAFLDNPRYVEPYRALLKTMESRQRSRLRALQNGSSIPDSTARGPSGQLAGDARDLSGGLSSRPNGRIIRQGNQEMVSPQVVVVSSPTDHEGKSSVATCLGAVSAMLGRRTLIIEADSLHPIQHTYLQVESAPGLTDVISHAQPLSEAVKLTTIGRLSLLPYGQSLNRPSTITESAAMRVLLSKLIRDYDLILIDTAPVDSSADAATVSQMTDGLLLVTRPGYTPRRVLADTVQQLRKSGAPLLGIAMNETILPEEQLGRLPRWQETGATPISARS
ncbi:MAG: polysaccharide biosynthesis tyrosine autokinase [Phormidesmis sp.]